ncbi:hypothetical protein ACFZC6_17085 [Streptomyces ossamyceticus]|uniref:hypothetical protein n=1 Tax=Streptomyces ossamyceticus TaxID=249581 RepID=UPI0036EA472C
MAPARAKEGHRAAEQDQEQEQDNHTGGVSWTVTCSVLGSTATATPATVNRLRVPRIRAIARTPAHRTPARSGPMSLRTPSVKG